MRYYLLVFLIFSFSCAGEKVAGEWRTIPPCGFSAIQYRHVNNYCPDFDSDVYHNRWVNFSNLCYVSNGTADSVFVINNKNIDFNRFIDQTKIHRLQSLSMIEKNLYKGGYPMIYFSDNLVKEWFVEDSYEDAEIFGYMQTPNLNYIVFRTYGACMGHSTHIISINKKNELVDHQKLTEYSGGKYGDGSYMDIQRLNDSVYYQIQEITTCKGWDDDVKMDSSFREYYKKTQIVFTHTGEFKNEILRVDSSLTFMKMVNICGPE